MFSRGMNFGVFSASALAVMIANPAFAEVDAKKVTDAISAQLAKQGLKVTVGSSTLDGANVIAKDISVVFVDSEPTKIEQVVLESVTEDGKGGYVIGKVGGPATTIEDKDIKFELGDSSITNYMVPAPDNPDPIASLGMYDAITVGPVKISNKGAEVFRMDGIKSTMSKYEAGKPFTFDASINGLWGDLTKIEDPQAQKTIGEFGYKEVTGNVTMKGSWNPTDGRMSITEGAYDFNDIGRLNVLMDISGYTPELVKALQEMNQKMGAGGDEAAQGMAMLGIMQQLSFNSMSIRFDDASITGKVLDYAAKQAGQDRAAIINQTKGIIPFALAQLQDPEFAQKVTEAASAYLDNPKSLEIKAAPAAAVPFAMLMATGSTAPQQLIKQLNVTVTANQ
jgi:hypothetical protein